MQSVMTKSVCNYLYLSIFMILCRQLHSQHADFNHRPVLHDMEKPQMNLNKSDTYLDNLKDQQNRVIQGRTSSRMSRLHETLLRARLQQLASQGLSADQLKTEASSTDVSGFTISQVYYLQGAVRKVTSKVHKMEVKVNKFEKWKTSSEERMASLEKMVQLLQKESIELKEKNLEKENEKVAVKLSILDKTQPNPDSNLPTREEFELLKQKTQYNAALITNITLEMEEREFIIKRQVTRNGRIHSQENDDKTSDKLRTPSSDLTTLSKSLHNLNETMLIQKKIVERLYARVGSTQKCCRMNAVVARRLVIHEKRIKQARDKSNLALKSLRIENSRIQSINTRLETQRKTVKALQDDMLSHNAIASKTNQRVIEQVEKNLETMNRTILSVIGDGKGTLTQKFKSLETEIAENSDTISSLAIYVGEQMDQIVSLNSSVGDLKSRNIEKNKEWKANMSRVEERIFQNKENMANMEINMRQLHQYAQDTSAKVDNNTATSEQLSKTVHEENMERMKQIQVVYDNIIDMNTTSKLLGNQLRGLRSQLVNAKTFELLTEDNLQILTEKIDNCNTRSDNMDTEYKKKLMESEKRITLYLASSMNETFQSIRSDLHGLSEDLVNSNEDNEIKFTELSQNMTGLERETSEMSDNIQKSNLDISNKYSALRNGILENTARVLEVAAYSSQNISSSVDKFQRSEERLRKNTEELRKDIFDFNQTLEDLQRNLKSRASIDETINIKKKIEQWDNVTKKLSEKVNIHEFGINGAKIEVALINSELEKLFDVSDEITSVLGNSTTLLETRFDDLSLHIDAKIGENEEKRENTNNEIKKRITATENANVTLYAKLESHVREMKAVKDGMTSLQEKENVVAEAISSFGNVIAKHDFVQRNLSSVSDKVKETLQGQGLALRSIHEIMNHLNESLVESQNTVDRSFFEQFQTQDGDIRAMKGLMQNFSSLLTKVFNDQLSHDVDHATISARQKSLFEKLDSFDDVMRISKSNSRNIDSVKSNSLLNTDKVTALSSHIDNTKHLLEEIERKTENLFKISREINSTQGASIDGMRLQVFDIISNVTNIFDSLADNKEAENSHEKEQVTKLDQISQDVENLKKESITQRDYVIEVRKKQSSINANVSQLMVNHDSTLKSRMADLETGVGSLEYILITVQNEISNLVDSDNLTKTELFLLQQQSQSLQNSFGTEKAEQKNVIDNLSSQVTELQRTEKYFNATISGIKHVLPEMLEDKDKLETAVFEIEEQKKKLQSLNETSLSRKDILEKLNTVIKSHTSTMQSLHNSNSDVISLVQTMQDEVSQQDKGLAKISRKAHRIDSELEELKGTVNNDAYDETIRKTKTLETNVSDIRDQLWYLAGGIERNYNSTQEIFEQLENHDERISLINGEATALLSSLASSVTSLDSSLQYINESLWFDINDMKQLLTDFQGAYDTTNRQQARYREEFEITTSNTSNQFKHLSTSIDYLTQIVQESNKAVDENRDRLNALNETMLFVRLSIPALLATGMEDELFEIEDLTGESPLFSLDDLTDASLQKETSDRDAILHGDVDEFIASKRMSSWKEDNIAALEDDYSENYDFGSLERRKRVVKDVRRIDHKMLDVLQLIESLQTNVYRIGNETENKNSLDAASPQISIESTVAFSAGLTERFECCGTVIFNKVFSNTGSGYDATTGKFTAAKSGQYAFFVTVSERNSYVNAAVVMNNMPQITVRMDHSAGNYEQSQSTNAVFLSLQYGDKVWLQTYSGSLLGYQYPAVTLSGFLISG